MSPQGRKVSFVEPPQVQHLAFSPPSTVRSSPICALRGLLRSSLARLLPLRASASAYGGSLRCSYTPLSPGAFKARIRIYSPYFPPSRLTIRLTRVPQQFLYFSTFDSV